MTIEGARGRRLLELAEEFPEDPAGCIACGAMAGCCSQYPNCPGNPDWRPSVIGAVFGVEPGEDIPAVPQDGKHV